MSQSFSAGVAAYVKRNKFPMIIAVVHWLSTFYTETLFIEVSRRAHLGTYAVSKLLALLALYGFWLLLWRAFSPSKGRENPARAILVYALPCLAVLVIYIFSQQHFTLISDELNIYNHAKQLDNYASWFVCYTGYYWISSLMILPTMMGPTYIKMLLQALVCGYIIFRCKRLTNSRWSFLLYLMFLLPGLLENGISGHRMPTYGILYLFFAAQLIFDHLEHVELNWKKLALLSVEVAVLTHWRSEGIYLVILGWILILLAYRVHGKKNTLKVILVFYCLHALVFLPQYMGSEAEDSRYINLRMQHFYAYSVVNMFRNGLSPDDCRQELESMSAVTDPRGFTYLNETYGDNNYADAYLLGEQNPYLKQGYSKDDLNEFCKAAQKTILENPKSFLRMRLHAWQFSSSQLRVNWSAENGVWDGIFNILMRPVYPFVLVCFFWLLALVRRRWLEFFLCSGVLCNWGIVAILMPAAFTKYFYVVYLIGYFLLFFKMVCLFSRHREVGA